MAIVIDGKALAAKVKGEVGAEVSARTAKPGLAVILVGDDPASRVYVNGKKRDCSIRWSTIRTRRYAAGWRLCAS